MYCTQHIGTQVRISPPLRRQRLPTGDSVQSDIALDETHSAYIIHRASPTHLLERFSYKRVLIIDLIDHSVVTLPREYEHIATFVLRYYSPPLIL